MKHELSKKGHKVGNKFNSKQRALLLAVMSVSLARVTGPAGGAGSSIYLLGQEEQKQKMDSEEEGINPETQHDGLFPPCLATNLPDSVTPADQ